MKFQKENKLGEIVVQFPAAEKIFQQFHIDYCCGGGRTLQTASLEEGFDLSEVLLALNTYYSDMKNTSTADWYQAPINLLVNHILQEHHAFLHTNLPKISDLVKTILRVHGKNHPELMEVYHYFHQLKNELDLHLIKEETIQYPAIERFLNTNKQEDLKEAVQIIAELEKEHDATGELLRKFRSTTNHYLIPDDACSTYLKTYQALEALEGNTFTHVHLENNILFIRLKNLLH
ncbi:MAG: iron-sulfur cluster repair di-iron protein [Bacilli bacterium]|nr:iron-sulfur cluster repair di-iron protein [Bacilli bacterium]